MAKRKSSTLAQASTASMPLPSFDNLLPPAPKRRAIQRNSTQLPVSRSMNPDVNPDVLDGPEALRASPDTEEKDERLAVEKLAMGEQVKEEEESESTLSELSDVEFPSASKKASLTKQTRPIKAKAVTTKSVRAEETSTKSVNEGYLKEPQFLDPEADGEEDVDEVEIQVALSRPPPVHSDYLPLPWKGRLGYACLCTYLRFSNPPVFSSRTCRIASILENRHPLKNPDEPAHATRNRPDREQPADIARGQAYVESLGLANARDVMKMLRWNERYGIKFMRLSSEMFPFASHQEYGYRLAPFASKTLADVGKIAAKLGHRLTTHPGQFTQLGSPRKQVIDNAFRDLDYHAEMLRLLKLPPQQDRDAVMILHLGGVFGDKEETLNRFRANYKTLPQGVKDRLVLENDDVSWSVHDLLPLCEELNIPMVLDFHHHNIIFDADKVREGTKDIVDLFPRILATWKRKNITPKMHYSEPTPAAITGRQRRKHSPRVATLPPCPPNMDLMIEAKDKEQAVFELMRNFKLPGFDTFSDMIPHSRNDENKPIKVPKKKPTRKKKINKEDVDMLEAAEEALEGDEENIAQTVIPEEDVGMGGHEGRVYWPPGMEEWLRPVKRVVKKKEPGVAKPLTPAQKRKAATDVTESAFKLEGEAQDEVHAAGNVTATPTPAQKVKSRAQNGGKKEAASRRKSGKGVPTPLTSGDDLSNHLPGHDILNGKPTMKGPKGTPARKSARAKKISYMKDNSRDE